MLLPHDELMLLSRGGRVPRSVRPGPVTVRPTRSELVDVRRARPRLAARLVNHRWLSWARRTAPVGRGELNPHAYLELEFILEDERRAEWSDSQ